MLHCLILGISISVSFGLTCLDCPNVKHPRFCEHVTQCDEGQLCGIEKITDEYEDTSFKLGCYMHDVNDTCLKEHQGRLENTEACFECCTNDLCNSQGCGEIDFKGNKGSICYECTGIFRNESCNKITFCNDKEMCYIEEQQRFGENYYHSGCLARQVCLSVQPLPVIGRRGVQRSDRHAQCCTGTLCNAELDSSSLSVVLGVMIQQKIICDGGSDEIVCQDNNLIKIISAKYGRYDTTTCGHESDTNCSTNTPYPILINQCNGHTRCPVFPDYIHFGDPCFGTVKYLTIQFQCVDL